jgi:hypothetical protein
MAALFSAGEGALTDRFNIQQAAMSDYRRAAGEMSNGIAIKKDAEPSR